MALFPTSPSSEKPPDSLMSSTAKASHYEDEGLRVLAYMDEDALPGSAPNPITEQETEELVKRVDWRLMPILCVTAGESRLYAEGGGIQADSTRHYRSTILGQELVSLLPSRQRKFSPSLSLQATTRPRARGFCVFPALPRPRLPRSPSNRSLLNVLCPYSLSIAALFGIIRDLHLFTATNGSIDTFVSSFASQAGRFIEAKELTSRQLYSQATMIFYVGCASLSHQPSKRVH